MIAEPICFWNSSPRNPGWGWGSSQHNEPQLEERRYIGIFLRKNRNCRRRKKGFLRKVHVQEILETLEILESPSSVENKGESDHLLEIPENLEVLDVEILEIPPVKDPFCNDPFLPFPRLWMCFLTFF